MIAEGLPAGVYTVILTADNGLKENAVFEFSLTVKPVETEVTPVPTDPASEPTAAESATETVDPSDTSDEG